MIGNALEYVLEVLLRIETAQPPPNALPQRWYRSFSITGDPCDAGFKPEHALSDHVSVLRAAIG
jgi:hypothetical protein